MKKLLVLALILQTISCVSKKEPGIVVSDEKLVELSKNVSSFTYFKNKPDTLLTDPSSEHNLYMRVRLNPKAITAMNDSLSNLSTASFPDESMIVKEMYDSKGSPLSGYVIMYKLRSGSDNSYGWLWGEYQADGTPIYSVSKKGNRCIACHLSPTNSDLIRTFSLH